jgi:uncharacterized protein (TIGR02145 family)
MKHLAIFVFLLTIFHSLAQSPESIAYQGILRNSSGDIISNLPATLRFTITEGSFDGNTVWQETQTTTTNANGLINLFIGSSQTLTNIDWNSGAKFLRVELQDNGDFVIIGNQQIVSVPYALFANDAMHSSTSDLAANATTSIFANSADSANFASNADVALSANTADFATSAETAESATTAEFATNAETANSANFSDFATNASSAQTAIFSNSADFASNAEGANTANFAAFADSSNYSTNSGIAAQSITSEFSDSSAIANHSNNATFALNAENAENANFAITSATAFSANNANSANSANSANVALNGIAGVSAIGDSLFLANGNFFIIPGISEANSSEVFGCSDPAACNYNPSVTQSNNSCYYPGFSCNDGDLNSSNDIWNSECQCQGTTGLVGSQHSCGAENVHSPDITYGSVVDQSGNIYKTVDINGQVWMAENLKTESYSNGDAIAFNLTSSQWQSITTGAWAHYDNNPAAACPYGKLYNWYAISDPRGLCPIGWHVPTNSDWNALVTSLDQNANTTCTLCNQSNIAGGALKSLGISYWETNVAATNSSGFSALPSGFRSSNGSYSNAGFTGFFWTSTDYSVGNAYSRIIYYNTAELRSNGNNKRSGFAVRCVQD